MVHLQHCKERNECDTLIAGVATVRGRRGVRHSKACGNSVIGRLQASGGRGDGFSEM